MSRIAAAIAEPARARMLLALVGGEALTATELSALAGISRQTASGHLGRLLESGLIAVQKQGRHRYHQLADPDVAELLERLMSVAERGAVRPLVAGPREPALRKARVCYDHLAGELAVACLDHMQCAGWIARGAGADDRVELTLTSAGRAALVELGLPLDALAGTTRRPTCRACLDWSVRRHHLAGALGALLLRHCFTHRWARRLSESRAIRFSERGELEFRRAFCGDGT